MARYSNHGFFFDHSVFTFSDPARADLEVRQELNGFGVPDNYLYFTVGETDYKMSHFSASTGIADVQDELVMNDYGHKLYPKTITAAGAYFRNFFERIVCLELCRFQKLGREDRLDESGCAATANFAVRRGGQ